MKMPSQRLEKQKRTNLQISCFFKVCKNKQRAIRNVEKKLSELGIKKTDLIPSLSVHIDNYFLVKNSKRPVLTLISEKKRIEQAYLTQLKMKRKKN